MSKVTCSGEVLKQFAAKANTVASKNGGDGVNAGIQLCYVADAGKDGQGELRMHAANMDVYYEGRFSAATDAIFKSEGVSCTAVVPAAVLHKIMQEYKRGQVVIEFGEHSVEITTADGCEYELPVHADSAEFQEVSWPSGASGVVPTVLLQGAFERAYPCLSQNPSQSYAITGARLRAGPDGFWITATNLAVLLRVRVPSAVVGEKSAVIPRAGVAAFQMLQEEHVTLTVGDDGIMASTASESIRILPVAQEYPNADALLDVLSPQTSTTMTAGDLLDGVRRVYPVLRGADPVCFVVKSDKKLELRAASDGRGKARIEVACSSNCPVGTETLFVPDYLISFLRPILGVAAKVLTWSICAPLKNGAIPSVFRVTDDILEFEFLVLPYTT